MSNNDHTILTLDDDIDFNKLLTHVLKKNDLHPITCSTVNEFASALKNKRPSLCLIDINLDVAQGAGFSLIQAIRKTHGLSLPLIILSRRGSQEDIARALELGADDFVAKPLDDIYLIQKISQYLNKSDIQKIPYSKISEKDWPCEITFETSVISLNEFGVTLESEHFFSKGTFIKLDGPFIDKIYGQNEQLKITIQSCWINEQTKKFNAFCEFNFNSPEQVGPVRDYILKNSLIG